MSKSRQVIIEALDEEFVRKMRNWVRSRTGNGFTMTTAYEGSQPSSGYAESMIPVLVGDAGDVDLALKRLAQRYREAVRLFWERDGCSIRWLGTRLKCSNHTAKARVERGHNDLRTVLENLKHQSDYFRQEAHFAGAMSSGNSYIEVSTSLDTRETSQ